MSDTIHSVLIEDRLFPPPAAFQAKARLKDLAEYERMYRRSIDDPEGFWGEQAKALIPWMKPFDKVLEWKEPFAKWFLGGQTNASVVCVDQHANSWRKNKAAIIWEGEPGEVRTLTYGQLQQEVMKLANVLSSMGLQKGDRVAIYMPMVPEAAIAMLACARLGAPHNVIFGGFSSEAVRDRVNDAGCKMIITADGGYRRGQVVALKPAVDEALAKNGCPTVEHVLVVKRAGNPVQFQAGRDHWWHEAMQKAPAKHVAEPMDAEHPLFLLYTSGSTGKPKGILHTTGGYLVGTTITSRYVFDLQDDDVYFCTADVGWITGHSYIVYGPLSNGATILMYEGAPNYPDFGRFWDLVEKHRVSIFYTAPTAIRAFIRAGDHFPARADLSSLRLLGSVGEPINPEAWMWYHRVIGGERCPVVDTWWQTETGAIMISPLPGVTATVPGSATVPFFGVDPEVVKQDGTPCGPNEGGLLILKRPWPSMLRGIWGDDQRYKDTYWGKLAHRYFAGDSSKRDSRGYLWIMGRVDDVLNVSGHRLGTAEVESALVQHPWVAEAAVVGRPDEIKGQAVVAFVTLKANAKPDHDVRDTLRDHVAKVIGAIAKPDDVRLADALPKTRSGKIMRRLLKEIAAGGVPKGDTSTLEDLSVLAKLKDED
ncbi:MAG: acetate--CoA ligase [Deltaproteobacteria bacterium]|nr:acetate--CoA ligase [Deltaproteobacteria bacterium]